MGDLHPAHGVGGVPLIALYWDTAAMPPEKLVSGYARLQWVVDMRRVGGQVHVSTVHGALGVTRRHA